ncbi:MAG TPA: penicillin-binding protein 2, partial [Candidatus Andersenbacteria bacterium]|nr:penicillin-binding protein 2 [Candidatus Andersenbacteria bacterium]
FDSILKGDLGFLSGERGANGQMIGVAANQFRPAQDGSDIVLTIDRVVQAFAEEELKAGVEKYRADRGSIVVMNPKTGAVIAMATFPTFDPNAYYAVRDPKVQTNPIVSDSFEPGSILKPIIMSGALNDGLVTPDTTFVDNGPVRVDKYLINTFDGKHHGVQTMTNILEQSNNVGMVWVAQKMGAERMYDYLRRFGIGERTGIELDGETQTNLKEPQKWNVATVATTGFGQGVVVTPIQALNAIDAIANNGMLMQPHIISSIKSSSGDEKDVAPTPVRQVITPETASKVSAMMVSVIENGVGHSARVPGYYLAGKTGTAQVADPETGKYSTENKIITFAGFGPVPDPQFSILIKLDNPYGLSFASGTSAPMFKDLAQKLLTYYQVPPSYDESAIQPKFQVP